MSTHQIVVARLGTHQPLFLTSMPPVGEAAAVLTSAGNLLWDTDLSKAAPWSGPGAERIRGRMEREWPEDDVVLVSRSYAWEEWKPGDCDCHTPSAQSVGAPSPSPKCADCDADRQAGSVYCVQHDPWAVAKDG